MLTADEGAEAEALVLGNPVVQRLVMSRYGVTDLSLVICDPWHAFSPEHCYEIRSSVPSTQICITSRTSEF